MKEKKYLYRLAVEIKQIPDTNVEIPDNGFDWEMTCNNKDMKDIFNNTVVKSINLLLDNPDTIGLKEGDIIHEIHNDGDVKTEVITKLNNK